MDGVYLPLADGTKKPPLVSGWQAVPPPPMVVGPGHNRGKRLDDDTDIDADCPEALIAAPRFLPETGRKRGRPSVGITHWWYLSEGAIYEAFTDVVKVKDENGKEKYQSLIEIRTGPGHYTVIPPSRVPVKNNGALEVLCWFADAESKVLKFADLRTAVVYIATTALLARHCVPDGERWKFYEALAGFLLGSVKLPADIVTKILDTVADIVKDTDTSPRPAEWVKRTEARLKNAQECSGGPTVAEMIGEHGPAVVAQIRKWFGITDVKADFPHTEAGDAEHFAALHAGRVSFDARLARWLLIEDESGLWLPDPVERLRGYAVEAMRERQQAANAINDLEKRKTAWNWAFKGESTTRLNNLLREARTQPAIRNDSLVDPWDADPFLLGVPGGVVDLRTGQLRKARPEERITMRAGAEYDPSARSPLWEKTLLEISDDDPEWVTYLQRLGGYTLTGDTSQDKWFIKHGKNGREGKGTVDEAWRGALGDYVLELPSAVFELRPKGNPDFDLSYLPCKRFVLSSESGNTVHLHHDRIKQMTGGGKMRVANKNQKSFEFDPSCKLWLACNDLPTVTDDSAAFWARVIVIPFRRSFHGKEDTSLRPILSNDPAHRRAVLAWLIKGAIDYCRDGLGDMPNSVKEATAAFRDVAWPLTPLVREDCIASDGARVSVGDFNSAYQRFCDRQGVPKDKRLGWKRVQRLMEARYETVSVDEMTQGDVRVREKRYVGIGLREPIAEEPVTFEPPAESGL